MTVRVTPLHGPGAGAYYVQEVGSYYLQAGEPAGVWFGRGAECLGLSGPVDAAAFIAVLDRVDPSTGDTLGRPFNDKSVRGFDLTFSAPKSVSVAAAVADDRVRAEFLAAHDAAVAAVLRYVESHAHTRWRVNGEVFVFDAAGVAVGMFRQHVSRELDPQLHTHVVIAAKVLAPDGRWLALDARGLMADQHTLTGLYHVGLRSELTSRLGVAWQEPVRGLADMVGIDEAVLDAFSQRTGQVTRRRDVKLDRFRTTFDREPTPRERWRLEREAVTDSRPSKPKAEEAATLQERWRLRLDELGVPADVLIAGVVGRVVEPSVVLDVGPDSGPADVALAELTERRSTWRLGDVVRELAFAVPTDIGLPAEQVVAAVEAAAVRFAAEWLVELAPPLREGVPLRVSDGRPVTESALDRRFSTDYILDEEQRLAAWAAKRWFRPGEPAALPEHELAGLSDAQRAAAEAVAGEAHLVVVVGPAGTGKTTALAPAVRHLQAEGRAVFGVAPSATAAAVLAEGTGVAADTIDKLLVEYSRTAGPSAGFRLPAGATVLVDESGMVATPKLAQLADLAEVHGWRVVLVGDPLQFSPVGRGGMFGWLVEAGPHIELDRVHRFTETWEAEASLQLRAGDTGALDVYDARGRLHSATPDLIDDTVLDVWWGHRQAGARVALLAGSNDSVARLNYAAQQRRIDAGELDPDGPATDGAHGYVLLVGDEIATRRNERALRTDRGEMVRNRDHWTVIGIEPDGTIAARGPSGRVRLPAGYVCDAVELAYAETGHAAQGRTVDQSLLLVDGPVDNRGVYVPLTRGRTANHAYVAVEADDPRSAKEVLAEAVRQDWADIPAIVVAAEQAEQRNPTGLLDPLMLRTLVGRRHDIEQLGIPNRVADLEHCQTRHDKELIAFQAAHRRLEETRAARTRAGDQLTRLSPWRLSSWQLRPTFEATYRQTNRDHAAARDALDTAQTMRAPPNNSPKPTRGSNSTAPTLNGRRRSTFSSAATSPPAPEPPAITRPNGRYEHSARDHQNGTPAQRSPGTTPSASSSNTAPPGIYTIPRCRRAKNPRTVTPVTPAGKTRTAR